MRGAFCPGLAAGLFWLAAAAGAAEYYVSPGDDLRTAIRDLSEGDTLYLNEGTYYISSSLWFGPGYSPMPASESGRYYIKAAPGASARPHVRCTNSGQNIVNVYGGRYFTIEGIEFSGGSHGIKFAEYQGEAPRYVTIKNCYVHHTAGPIIDMKGATHHITVTGCEIAFPGGTGECFYIGNSSEEDLNQVNNCVIVGNLIHDTFGTSNGDGIELKWKTYANQVRDNVIYNVNFPGIFVYGHPGRTSEADLTVVEGNVIFSGNENGVQVYNTAVIRNNIIFDVAGRGIEVRPYAPSGTPYPVTNVRIVNNTLYNCNSDPLDGSIRLNDLADASGVVIANNAVCSFSSFALLLKPMGGLPSTSTRFYSNLWYSSARSKPIYVDRTGTSEFDAAEFHQWLMDNGYAYPDDGNSGADPQFSDSANNDFYPRDTSPLIDMGTAAFAPSADFDGVARDAAPDVGAYEWTSGGGPGWIPGGTFKGTSTGPYDPGGGGAGGGCHFRPGSGGVWGWLFAVLMVLCGWGLLRASFGGA